MQHNKTELEYYINGACKGNFTIRQVCESTGYSRARVSVLKRNYRLVGKKAFVNGNKGRTPANKLPDSIKKRVIDIYKNIFIDKENNCSYNFTLCLKCLKEDYDINISYWSLYHILTGEKIASPKKRHVKHTKPVHRIRARRKNEGDLIQIDATPYDWMHTGKMQSIHGGIDDATGKITGLYMCENECLYGYIEINRQMLERNGKCREMYMDRSGIFCFTPRKKDDMTVAEQLSGLHEKQTQFQRMLGELSINQILAYSPQAKGRIERLWKTLQGRLPWYFKKYNVHTIEQANIFLKKYIDIYNKEFAIQPNQPESFYRPITDFEKHNLDNILCVRIHRHTDGSGVFSFHGYKFQLLAKYPVHKEFELCISERYGFKAFFENLYYDVEFIDDVQDVITENEPQVLKNLLYRYYYDNGKVVND